MQKMTVEEKAKRLSWMLLSRFLAVVSGVSVCLVGIMIAENLMTSPHWIMAWGFIVLSISGWAYRTVVRCAA